MLDPPYGDRPIEGTEYVRRDDDAAVTPEVAEPAALQESAPEPATEEPAAAEPTSLDESSDLKPGEVPGPLIAAIWTEDSARDFRDRWRETQLRFVDDPRTVAEDARNLVDDVVEAHTAMLANHREQLNSWQANGDTEQYRVVVQRYRSFLDRLLSL